MPKTVLIAEDEPHIVESLTFLLARAGFGVRAFDDGQIAFDSVLAEPPDMVILDVMLPKMSGFDILKGLRALPEFAGLPILLLTAKGQRRDREIAEAHGADAFIAKPFANDDVVCAVRRLIG